MKRRFEYHQKLHHSQTLLAALPITSVFEYHQKLHHSQTYSIYKQTKTDLSTIRNYITLKH